MLFPSGVSISFMISIGLGDRHSNMCNDGGTGKHPRSADGPEGPPATAALSARLNPFRGVPTTTDSELAEVPAPRQYSIDAEASKGAAAEGVDLEMRCPSVENCFTTAVNAVRLAGDVARERVVVVGSPDWDDLYALD